MDIKQGKTVIIIMGVSGCGKTTIGKLLSKRLKLPFFDADNFHSQENINKMKQGVALNDTDRLPWLETLSKALQKWSETSGVVLACSALKENYRTILSSKAYVTWVYLSGSFDLIFSRMQQREGHFMKADLLKSQFNDLEIPKYGVHIDISHPPETIINTISLKIAVHE
ncbi:gluconokinase [Snuella sedimenti]|uniref:Gluconokinase n=1 Tax=Snuella sedimenti TaxID=2798802 RepID=A0A8J7IYK0_9FLAO|nr:gluconokinase [Snuella sedimenti]MBJ6368975.1 gluconokinase [Snuella sedimenti]